MYKLSTYNYIIPKDDRMIYFNGISGQVFSLNTEEHNRIQELFKDLISFEIEYTSVFSQFQKWGFIIDQSTDEIDLIRYKNRMEVYNYKAYKLVINPTLECNFSCWYCYEKHPQGYMSPETIEKVKKHISYMVEEDRITALNLSWFGGEPLLYFDEVIYPISLYAKEICQRNKIPFSNGATTNASKINPEMVDKINAIDMSHFQITLDGDEKRHNKIRNEQGEPSFQHIVDNINLLCEKVKEAKITLRLNYDEKTLNDCDLENMFKSFPEKNRKKISTNFQRVWQTHSKNTGENATRIHLHKTCSNLGFSSSPIANRFNLGGFHKCYADRLYHAEINYDGKVYQCTAQAYADKHVAGKLLEDGRIIWNSDKIAKRLGKATFENDMCLVCKYLPLCMGPCSQRIIETPKEQLHEICCLNNTEITPETMIIDYYEQKMKALQEENQKAAIEV